MKHYFLSLLIYKYNVIWLNKIQQKKPRVENEKEEGDDEEKEEEEKMFSPILMWSVNSFTVRSTAARRERRWSEQFCHERWMVVIG